MIGRALLAMLALAAPAQARVFTNTDEVRACVPLPGGDTLVGTGGGLVRVDPAGIARQVWTASDGLPGTRIDALVADGERVWVGTDAGVAELAVPTLPPRAVAVSPLVVASRAGTEDSVMRPDPACQAPSAGRLACRATSAAELASTVSHAVATRPLRDIARSHDPACPSSSASPPACRAAGRASVVSRAVATRPVRDIARWHGAIYLATWDGGVIELGRGAVAMRGGAAAPRMRASSLAVAGGTLWAGTAAGLYRMRGGRLVRVDGPRDVTALVADGDDLWIGASDGMWTRDGDGVRGLGGGEVRHLAVVDGAVVAAGVDGLVTIDRGRVVPLAGAPRGFAQAIGAAHDAVCTGGLDGLWTRTHSTWHHAPPAGGPPSSDISALVADGARLWVGTFDQGLASYDPDRGWRRIAGPDPRINALALEPRPDGARVWVATAQGIQVVDAAGNTVLRLGRNDGLPSRGVLSIAVLGDGRIVAGTSAGAAFVDGGSVRRVGPRAAGARAIGNVWAIAETPAGLWLGTTTGLYRGRATSWLSKAGSDDDTAVADPWQRLSVATGHLHDDWVTALAAKGNVVWAGTYNGGVTRIDGDLATSLGGGWVNPSGLLWDGDRLLAATMDGLVTGDGQRATWTATPALPGRDVTAAVRVGPTLWVATRRGLAALD